MNTAATEESDAEAEAPPVEDEAPREMFGAPWSEYRGQLVLHPSLDTYVATIEALRDDGFISVIDLCGVDYLTNGTRQLPDGVAPERFEIVVNLISHQPPRRARVRLQVPESEPVVPTLFDHFPGTEAMEREAFDMFGITFTNHPDPTRILMPSDWDGHPLRKDFGVGAVPVQFKGAPAPR
jgi:NADH-quinone oxidoreductase subunit C